jgi:HEAT repeat protein
MHVAPLLIVAATLVIAGPGPSASEPPPDTTEAERVVTSAGLATDGESLLAFFRGRTGAASDVGRLNALTRQLGDPVVEVRARATAALVASGAVAIPVLRHAVNDLSDPAVAERARACLKWIEGPDSIALAAAAARLIAVRKPAGAAQVLLAYLPFADDPGVVDQVGQVLASLAFSQGKADPDLVNALLDPVPLRRAVAGEALCRRDQPGQWPAVRQLLNDSKAAVRLRVALALAKQHDVESIPVLIELIADLPAAQRKQAEEVLQELAGEWAPAVSLQGDDDVSRRIRRDAWAGWWRNTEGEALLGEFRKRTLGAADLAKIQDLIDKLADDVFATREQAANDLVAFGALAAPLLREAVKSAELERVRRAERCLTLIANRKEKPLPLAAPRLVAVRKPPGAVEVLLAYLPWADGEPLHREVQQALTALALHDGRPDSALLQALNDPLPQRRAAAGEALARAGVPDLTDTLHKLFHDPDPTVRQSVALALTVARDREAVPVLIDTLAELPPEQASRVQESLFLLAGDNAPAALVGTDPEARTKCRDAWAAWWRAEGHTVDLARLETGAGLLGYTLLVQVQNNGIGRVLEIGRDGKPRWQIDGLQYPVDAHVLGGNRVLIAEYNGRKITERDFRGNVLWEKQGLTALPTNVQRLPSGNTFIATNGDVLEVDRTGNEVFRRGFGGQHVTAAYKMRNGEMVVLLGQGTCVRLDSAAKEIKTFPSGRDSGWTSGIDVLPNGHILISQPNRNMVSEFDADGKSVWHADAPGITTATRLANGHVLVASYNAQTVVELDRAGKVVWQHKDEYHQFRARRR